MDENLENIYDNRKTAPPAFYNQPNQKIQFDNSRELNITQSNLSNSGIIIEMDSPDATGNPKKVQNYAKQIRLDLSRPSQHEENVESLSHINKYSKNQLDSFNNYYVPLFKDGGSEVIAITPEKLSNFEQKNSKQKNSKQKIVETIMNENNTDISENRRIVSITTDDRSDTNYKLTNKTPVIYMYDSHTKNSNKKRTPEKTYINNNKKNSWNNSTENAKLKHNTTDQQVFNKKK